MGCRSVIVGQVIKNEAGWGKGSGVWQAIPSLIGKGESDQGWAGQVGGRGQG